MPRIELTRVQEDCLEHRGQCATCPNNILESGPCQVKHSRGVARKLGLKEIKSHGVNRLKEPVTKVCAFCDREFAAWLGNAKFCTQCAALRKPSHGIRMCRVCGVRFFGDKGKRRCDRCRDESSVGKERRTA